MAMRVGELARRTGVGVSTLRAWERRFRFLEPQRSAAGHRLYDEADVDRVCAVLRLVGEGLTLAAAITRVASAGTGALPEGEGEALLYGQILLAADLGIWVSKDGRTRYANRRAAELMGYSVEDLVSIPVLDFFDPEDLPEVRLRTASVRAGERLHFRTRLRRADGSWFLAEITTTPLVDSSGRYDGGVAILTDVSAADATEKQARLRAALLDSIGEAVTASNTDGEIVYINAAAERLFGWRLDEVIGRQGRPLITALSAQDHGARIHESLLKGRRYNGTLRMTKRDGSDFDAHLTCTPALGEDGSIVGLVAVVNDLTERDQRDRDVRLRELQAETLALLGTRALQHVSDAPMAIVDETVDATRRMLRVDRASMLELDTDDEHLEVRVASPATNDRIVVPAGSRSFSGYVTLARKVVVVDDTDRDDRFDKSDDTGQMPTSSAIGAPIFVRQGIIGVLVAESARPRSFVGADTHFLQSMANIIGTAMSGTSHRAHP
jgi:PAS domain S-box-containing protein